MRNRTSSLTRVMERRSPLLKSLRLVLIVASLMVIVSIITGCAVLNGSLWASATPQLEYSEDLSAWGISCTLIQRVDMAETPPETGWIEPEPPPAV